MNSKTYIKNAKRTEIGKYSFKETNGTTPRIEHGVIGVVTEAGELMSAVKKSKIYGQKLDRLNLIEEIGDIMWYLAILSDELGVNFETIWDKNIRKLKARYPDKYTNKKAKVRNLHKERKELEK